MLVPPEVTRHGPLPLGAVYLPSEIRNDPGVAPASAHVLRIGGSVTPSQQSPFGQASGLLACHKPAWAPSDSTARSFRLGTPAARNGSNSAFITPGMDSRRNNPGAPWLRRQPLKCICCWGRASTWAPSGLNHSAVEIRFQLLEPPGQAVTGEVCAEKGKINLRDGR